MTSGTQCNSANFTRISGSFCGQHTSNTTVFTIWHAQFKNWLLTVLTEVDTNSVDFHLSCNNLYIWTCPVDGLPQVDLTDYCTVHKHLCDLGRENKSAPRRCLFVFNIICSWI